VARRDNHLILGWQAVGVAVSELSTAFAQSLEMGACLEDVAGTDYSAMAFLPLPLARYSALSARASSACWSSPSSRCTTP